jgi:thiamine-phosphate pyrophosphorylase
VLDRDDPRLAEALVVGAGARVLQLRMKAASAAAQLAVVRWLRPLTRAHGCALVINDRVDLALAAEADGVHLGQEDLPLEAARRLRDASGARLWIGISTHDEAQVRAAVSGGADYLGFGPVFATVTKANPDPVQGLDGLRRAVIAAGSVPVVAIGGLDPARAVAVARQGAAAACAIAAVNDAPDPAAEGRRIASPWLDPPGRE